MKIHHSHIKDLNHFINSVKYTFRKRDIVLPPNCIDNLTVFYEWCHKHYYLNNAPDKFIQQLMEYQNLQEYHIKKIKKEVIDEITFSPITVAVFSEEFKQQARTLVGKAGVYFIYSQNKSLLYIGRSINLPSRVASSLNERKKGNPRFVQFLPTKTRCDAAILEAYFVGKEKPAMNGDMSFADSISIKISKIPPKTKMIQIFRSNVDI